jgi:hypothetical protein
MHAKVRSLAVVATLISGAAFLSADPQGWRLGVY